MGLPVTIEVKRKKKQRVPGTSQVGAVQAAILDWLLTREQEISAGGKEHEKLILEARGVPWDVKAFCKTSERACKPDGSPDSSKVSTSLKQLEVPKRLVQTYGKRTSHVKLTKKGREYAQGRRDDPRTWQEKRAENTARRRAYAIEFEINSYGNQMTKVAWYTGAARYVYYLNVLRSLGRLSPKEIKDLEGALIILQGEQFKDVLPDILNQPGLNERENEEVRAVLGELNIRDVYAYSD